MQPPCARICSGNVGFSKGAKWSLGPQIRDFDAISLKPRNSTAGLEILALKQGGSSVRCESARSTPHVIVLDHGRHFPGHLGANMDSGVPTVSAADGSSPEAPSRARRPSRYRRGPSSEDARQVFASMLECEVQPVFHVRRW